MKKGQTKENKEWNLRKVKIRTIVLFSLLFLVINSVVHMQLLHHKDKEQLKATYTAEDTVRRIESQISQYLTKTELLKRIMESGGSMDKEQFDGLADYMMDDDGVIDAIELAKDGIVTNVYPVQGNEAAEGLNFFEHPQRKESACIAKDSGEYTIAGPFELVQGGQGALLFDPIYVKDAEDTPQFWGFAVLVIDWDRFVEELQLDKLEDASYQYRIWKTDPSTGDQITLAKCKNADLSDALEVPCEVPNDTWYFEIVPTEGWYSNVQLYIDTLICAAVTLLIAVIYWQFQMRRHREDMYAEKMRKAAEKAEAANRAKTSFMSKMSHDIRTPLNGIIGLLKIDENHPDDHELIRENRKKMQVSADHLLELINDVLQMSKLENEEITLAHEYMDLNELTRDIRTIIGQRAADSGISMIYERNSDKLVYPYVYGSSLHMRQLFLNIYGNCIKYNKPNGSISIHVDYMGSEAGRVTYRWTIADTGIGMSEEFLKRIYEPFAQEQIDARSVYKGSGLGMTIVKSLVDKMGGTIEIKSKEGEGTEFRITLPFDIAEERKELPKKQTGHVDIHGLHLLLAEDNELNAEIARMLLEDEGAELTIVKNGQQAVDAFEHHPQGTFDAILMDIMMPVMDGIQATRVIRSIDRPDAKSIPIIAMTANAFDEDAKKCFAAGMNEHLSKPLRIELVTEALGRFCGREDTQE